MQLAGSGLVKSFFTITQRWEQTQQMCGMRKEKDFSPVSMRSWPSHQRQINVAQTKSNDVNNYPGHIYETGRISSICTGS